MSHPIANIGAGFVLRGFSFLIKLEAIAYSTRAELRRRYQQHTSAKS